MKRIIKISSQEASMSFHPKCFSFGDWFYSTLDKSQRNYEIKKLAYTSLIYRSKNAKNDPRKFFSKRRIPQDQRKTNLNSLEKWLESSKNWHNFFFKIRKITSTRDSINLLRDSSVRKIPIKSSKFEAILIIRTFFEYSNIYPIQPLPSGGCYHD